MQTIISKKKANPSKENQVRTYPFSNPTCKFLDWENGVVGGSSEDWELREGSARESGEKARFSVRAKESKLGRRNGVLEFWELSVRWSEPFFVESVQSGGEERRLLKHMPAILLLSA